MMKYKNLTRYLLLTTTVLTSTVMSSDKIEIGADARNQSSATPVSQTLTNLTQGQNKKRPLQTKEIPSENKPDWDEKYIKNFLNPLVRQHREIDIVQQDKFIANLPLFNELKSLSSKEKVTVLTELLYKKGESTEIENLITKKEVTPGDAEALGAIYATFYGNKKENLEKLIILVEKKYPPKSNAVLVAKKYPPQSN